MCPAENFDEEWDRCVAAYLSAGGSRAIEAKEVLMKRKITAAPVVDEHGRLCGAINLQDFYQAGIIYPLSPRRFASL